MKRLAFLIALTAAGCNPAQVEPAPSNEGIAAPRPIPAAPGEEAKADVPSMSAGFAATGAIPCVTRAGWRLRDCTAGVVRNGDGSATVTVFHPEGRSRDIQFDAAGRATGVRTAEADGSDRQPFSARRSGGVTIVRLGPERYEVPDAMVRGD